MSDTRSSRSDVTTSGPERTGWVGWIAFASSIMVVLGIFQVIEGFVAIFDDGYYRVAPSGLVVNIDYTAWGWAHLLLGLLIVASGVGLLSGNVAARTVAVVLAGLSAILNLLFIEAHPVWAIIVIAVAVLVIYAVTVHGRELSRTRL
jgi:hypothetical protein